MISVHKEELYLGRGGGRGLCKHKPHKGKGEKHASHSCTAGKPAVQCGDGPW